MKRAVVLSLLFIAGCAGHTLVEIVQSAAVITNPL
jgi:hypothetical protein